jgi:translation initiation factor 3 subunit L
MAFRGEAFEREGGAVPDIVKQFVVYLYRHIRCLPASSCSTSIKQHAQSPASCRERNIPEIKAMYELSFQKLSERFYKQTRWPPAEAIQDLVDQDHVFCLLYKVSMGMVAASGACYQQ